jgi:hypothetical protein
VPAGDADVLDEQPEQLLFLDVIEAVDDVADARGEVVNTLSDLIVAGECGALFGEVGAFGGQLAAPRGDFGGAALHFGQFDQSGLVEVDQATAFGLGGVDFATQPGQFGGE